MTRKQRRLTMIGVAGLVLCAAVGLILYSLSDQIVFFRSPSDIAAGTVPPGQRIRIGGLVEEGTVVHTANAHVTFKVTDTAHSVPVTYTGLLPDLFREGQGVVAEGQMGKDGVLHADTILAKHDERYMPKEVVDALKEQGVWEEGQDGKPVREPSDQNAKVTK